MLTPDPDGEVRTEDAYREYRDWCTQNGQYPDSYPTFKRGMEGYAQIRKKRPNGAGKSVNPTAMFCGVQLKAHCACPWQT
jgi:putative DNA primase/helicase